MFSNRQNQIIREICNYDEWFETLVKYKSYEVVEKMDHLWKDINLQLLSEKGYENLIDQIRQFYKEKLDPNSYWESITDFNYQIKFIWKENLKEYETILVEKDPYDSDTDDENEDLIDEKDIEEKSLMYDSFKNEDISAIKLRNNSINEEEHKMNDNFNKQDCETNTLNIQICDVTLACEDKPIQIHKFISSTETETEAKNAYSLKNKTEEIKNKNYSLIPKQDHLQEKNKYKAIDNVNNIIDHGLTHIYSCDICGFNAEQRGSVTTHIESGHENPKFTCEQCQSLPMNKAEIEKPVNIIHKETISNNISKNDDSDDSNDNYLNDDNDDHSAGKMIDNKCEICGLSFDSNMALKEHISEYSKIISYNCNEYLCYYETEIEHKLKEHQIKKHSKKSTDEELDFYDLIIEDQIIDFLEKNGYFAINSVEDKNIDVEYDDSLIELSEDSHNNENKNNKIFFSKNVNPNFEISIKEEIEKELNLTYSEVNDKEANQKEIYQDKNSSLIKSELKIDDIEKKRIELYCDDYEKDVEIFTMTNIQSELKYFNINVKYKQKDLIKFIKTKNGLICDKCDNNVNRTHNLWKHKASVHEQVQCSCDICVCNSKRKENFKMHTKIQKFNVGEYEFKDVIKEKHTILKLMKEWKKTRKKKEENYKLGGI